MDVVREVMDRMDAVLATGAALSVDDLREALRDQVSEAMAALHASTTQPQLLHGGEDPSEAPIRPWATWGRQARARIDLCETMLGFYADIEEVRDDLLRGVAEVGPQRVKQGLDDAACRVGDEEDALRDRLGTADAPSEVPLDALEERLERAAAVVEEEVDTLRCAEIDSALREVIEDGVDRMQTLVEELPSEVRVHAVPDDEAPLDASAEERVVPIRSGAEVTWDVLFFDRLRTATQRLGEGIAEEMDSAADIPSIIEFSRDAVREELAPLQSSPDDGADDRSAEKTGPASLQHTEELVLGGLERSARALADRRRRVDAAALDWADTVWKAFRQGMVQLHDRLSAESRFRDRLAQLSSRLSREARTVASDAHRQVQHGHLQARRWLHTAHRQFRGLLETGWAAMGLDRTTEEEVHDTVETLASLNEALERLPVVYRRLFSFQPVDDPELFVGREEDREFIEQHVRRWRQGIPAPLVLIGDRGAGMTSLLKHVRTTILRDAQLHHLRVEERPSAERDLAVKVARALQLSVSPATRDLTLEDVGDALPNAPTPEGIRACFVEHLE